MKNKSRNLLYLSLSLLLSFSFLTCNAQNAKGNGIWTKKYASKWYKAHDWQRGCNFIPSTAVNQLEMWQAETFDTATINRELGWAQSIGFNCVRVFLHHAVWEQDPAGFKSRINQYLAIADKHHISTMFVLFDDCWNESYKLGKQPDPVPGKHNSGWVRDPGKLIYDNPAVINVLKKYVKDILSTYKNDKRILLWDLYNEPGNSNYGSKSLPLLKEVFAWARTVKLSQPISSGVWNIKLTELNKFQLSNSDIITYHNYENEKEHALVIDSLSKLGRPLICTEYMARRNSSLFCSILPLLKQNNIGAINWGLVQGKTNTIYAWDEPIPDGSEPKLWFHDIFRTNGMIYKQEEVDCIKRLTGK
jgi:hypothetical protein